MSYPRNGEDAKEMPQVAEGDNLVYPHTAAYYPSGMQPSGGRVVVATPPPPSPGYSVIMPQTHQVMPPLAPEVGIGGQVGVEPSYYVVSNGNSVGQAYHGPAHVGDSTVGSQEISSDIGSGDSSGVDRAGAGLYNQRPLSHYGSAPRRNGMGSSQSEGFGGCGGAMRNYGPGPPITTSNQSRGQPGCNLFCFHLPNEMTNWDLYLLFRRFGNIISVHIMINKESGLSRGFGFISFENKESASAAIQQLNGFRLGVKRLKVQYKRGYNEYTSREDGIYDLGSDDERNEKADFNPQRRAVPRPWSPSGVILDAGYNPGGSEERPSGPQQGRGQGQGHSESQGQGQAQAQAHHLPSFVAHDSQSYLEHYDGFGTSRSPLSPDGSMSASCSPSPSPSPSPTGSHGGGTGSPLQVEENPVEDFSHVSISARTGTRASGRIGPSGT